MDKVLYERRGRIAYITLNRPKTLNASAGRLTIPCVSKR
jgi:enoyl-CoA hydratase/carnithine racemase